MCLNREIFLSWIILVNCNHKNLFSYFLCAKYKYLKLKITNKKTLFSYSIKSQSTRYTIYYCKNALSRKFSDVVRDSLIQGLTIYLLRCFIQMENQLSLLRVTWPTFWQTCRFLYLFIWPDYMNVFFIEKRWESQNMTTLSMDFSVNK